MTSEEKAKIIYLILKNYLDNNIEGGRSWSYEYEEYEGERFLVMCGDDGNFYLYHEWDEDDERMCFYILEGRDQDDKEFDIPFEKKLQIIKNISA